MADVSLDDYIQKKRFNYGGNRGGNNGPNREKVRPAGQTRGNRGNFNKRLGMQTAKAKKPQFTVTMTGKPAKQNFDVREKLLQNKKKQIKDARDEIVKKTKFVDARVRIKNAQAKKGPKDAREKIKSKQQETTASSPEVVVTGLGRVHHKQGHLVVDEAPSHTVQANSSNILITSRNNLQTRVEGNPENLPRLPKVMIKNEYYQRMETIQSKKQTIIPIQVSTTVSTKPVTRSVPIKFAAHSVPSRPLKTVKPGVMKKAAPSVLRIVDSPVMEEDEDELTTAAAVTKELDVTSPLQGFRVMITNLHPVVTQEDIVELFSAIGALKKARLIKQGTADVVFVQKQDAMLAVKKYHNRELDGKPMQVRLAISTTAKVATPQAAKVAKPVLPSGLSLDNKKTSDVDVSVIHKALFKTAAKSDAPTKPVTFTIKI